MPARRPRVPAGFEVSLGLTRGRMALLAGLGTLLGLVGGAAAFAVVRLVGLLSNLALLHRVGVALPNLRHYHPGAPLVGVALAGGLVIVALAAWTPVIRGHGIPESLEAIMVRESRIPPRVLLAKPLSAAIAMGTGGPFGAEGPIIVTGGAIGSLLGQLLPVSAAERRILLATGAAAGMAGVFGTPVAAVILAFELLLFERSLRALLPLLLATGTATEVHYLLLGNGPLFPVQLPLTFRPVQLPLFVLLGVAAGLLAVGLNGGLTMFEEAFERSRLPPRWHPALGALAYAGIGLLVPGSLSVGYWAISGAVNGRFAAGAAAVLFAGKLFSWWIALASNTSGGTLAPMFILGATMGEAFGIGLAHLFPGLSVQPAAFALVAMGVVFGTAARAPLTGVVFALEVTGAYQLVVPMLVAMGVGELVAEQLLTERIMTDRLRRRGYRVDFDAQVDPLRTVVVGQLMEPLPSSGTTEGLASLARHAPLADALPLFLRGEADHLLVLDDGRPVGLLPRGALADVLLQRAEEATPQPPTIPWGTRRWRSRRPPGRGAPERDVPP